MQITTPSVTIISPFYNRGYAVKESVDCLLAQSYQNTTVVLIDDGSTDNTLEELKRYEGIDNVRIESGLNRGLTKALSETIQKYKDSEYIAIHGSGDISRPTRIERQVAVLQQNPDWAIAGCWVVNIHPDGTREDYRRRSAPVSSTDLLERNYFTHGEVMIRRSSYERVGGYRQSFPMAQDYDLWLRMLHTEKGGFVEEPLYERSIRDDGIEANPTKKLMQLALVSLARRCCIMRMHFGKDAIEMFGPNGALLLLGNDDLATKLRNAQQKEKVKQSDLKQAYEVMAAINEFGPDPDLVAGYLTDEKKRGKLKLRRRVESRINRIFGIRR